MKRAFFSFRQNLWKPSYDPLRTEKNSKNMNADCSKADSIASVTSTHFLLLFVNPTSDPIDNVSRFSVSNIWMNFP